MYSLVENNGVSHGGMQTTASMEQPGGAGLVLEVRKGINSSLLQLPLHFTAH